MAAIAALIAGGALSAGSSYLGAKDQAGDVRRNQQFNESQYNLGANRLGQNFYGQGVWGAMQGPAQQNPPMAPQMPRGWQADSGQGGLGSGGRQSSQTAANQQAWAQYDQQMQAWNASAGQRGQTEQQRQDYINQSTGGPLLGQLRGLGDQARTGGQDYLNSTTAGFGALNQRGDQRLSDVAGLYSQGQNQLGQMYAQGGGQVDAMARNAEGTARQFGQGRGELIRSDSADRLKGLNQQTDASLAGLGVNSIGANQKASNTAQVGREQDRALTDVGDQQAQLLMQAQMSRAGMANQRFGQQAGAQGQLLGQGISAQDEIMGQNLSRQYQQQQTVGGIRGQNLERNLQYGQMPVNAQLGLLQGSTFNPYAQNPQQYIPTANSFAAAGGSMGNTLGVLGGYGMANGGFSGNAVKPTQGGGVNPKQGWYQ